MKRLKLFSLLAAICVLGTATACGPRSDEVASRAHSSTQATAIEATPPAQTLEPTPESLRPSTKTETMSVEGEQMEIPLTLYDEASEVFTTYFPQEEFVVESVGSGEGTGARFYFSAGGTKNEAVYVALFFPAQAMTQAQMQTLVNQVMQTNQWEVVNQSTDVPYAWAKERIVFEERTGSEPISGEVYLGEANGKAFYAITHYPVEYAEGFGPRVDIILKNLQVKSN